MAADAAGILGWPETSTTEFKETVPGRDGRHDAWFAGGKLEQYGKDKLFKELVALANSSGGHLVLGVSESSESPGVAAELKPVARCVELAECLIRSAQVIDPPIPMLQVKGLPTEGEAGLIIFRVPASRSAPHRSSDKECYKRNGTESLPMSMREIQDLTLAVGHRLGLAEQAFQSATDDFNFWFEKPSSSEKAYSGFRITAVPIGGPLSLGRLPDKPQLFCRDSAYNISFGNMTRPAPAYGWPQNARPIIRGVRWTFEDSTTASFCDMFSNGRVNFGIRSTLHAEEFSPPPLHLGSIVTHLANVLRTVDATRGEGGSPALKYGIELALDARPFASTIRLLGLSPQLESINCIGMLSKLLLSFPRLSFGQSTEVLPLANLVVTDLCDAVGSTYANGMLITEIQPRSP